jgi:hypothetical protein
VIKVNAAATPNIARMIIFVSLSLPVAVSSIAVVVLVVVVLIIFNVCTFTPQNSSISARFSKRRRRTEEEEY